MTTNLRDDFIAWLGADVALAVNANTDGIRFQAAIADDEHGVDFICPELAGEFANRR